MIIANDIDEFIAFKGGDNQIIGYHSSVYSACSGIERVGFLPDKIFPLEEHRKLLEIAEVYKIDSLSLQSWFSMWSVTFTRRPEEAIKHIQQGSAGGQGLKNLTAIIEKLPPELSREEKSFIDCLREKIQRIRTDQPVSYIVDLTDLGARLDPDHHQPFYYYRWNPAEQLPKKSEVGPERILMKLVHKDAVSNAQP